MVRQKQSCPPFLYPPQTNLPSPSYILPLPEGGGGFEGKRKGGFREEKGREGFGRDFSPLKRERCSCFLEKEVSSVFSRKVCLSLLPPQRGGGISLILSLSKRGSNHATEIKFSPLF